MTHRCCPGGTPAYTFLLALLAMTIQVYGAGLSMVTPVGERLDDAYSIAAADIDNDGVQEILVGNNLGFTVLSGRGKSQFDFGRLVRIDCLVTSLAVADFNKDGMPDVASLCPESGLLVVTTGTGGGQFQIASRIPLNTYHAHGLLALDWNQDGIPDLAAAQFDGVAVLTGLGDGTFARREELITSNPVRTIVGADFNGDRIPDLAANKGETGIVIWFGTGTGEFAESQTPFPTLEWDVQELAARDFNADGRVDLAAACSEGVIVLLANGTGAFQSAFRVSEDAEPISITAGDLTGDGIADLVIGTYFGVIRILAGRGDGTFSALAPLGAMSDVPAVAVADVNGDSKPDILAACYASHTAMAAFGQGGGEFGNPVYFGAPAPFLVTAASGSGTDLAVVATFRREIYILHRGRSVTATIHLPDYPMQARFADFDKDGITDVLTASLTCFCQEDPKLLIRLFMARPNGEFLAPIEVASVPYPLGPETALALLEVADFTGDGLLDFVFSDNSKGTLQVYLATASGNFRPAAAIEVQATALAADDLNGDGMADLAVVNSAGATTVYGAASNGEFRKSTEFAACTEPTQIFAGRLSNSNRKDLLIVCATEVTVMLNNGGGVFQKAAPLKFQNAEIGPADVADFDNDGRIDLAVSQNLNSLWGGGAILASNGDGTFRTYAGLALPPQPVGFKAGHWDDDGKLDLAVLSGREFTVTLLMSGEEVRP